MARRKQLDPERLIAAADLVLGVIRAMGATGTQRIANLITGPSRPSVLADYSEDELAEAAMFLKRLGVVESI